MAKLTGKRAIKKILTKEEQNELAAFNEQRIRDRSELERRKALASWDKRRAKQKASHTPSHMTLNQRLTLEAAGKPVNPVWAIIGMPLIVEDDD